MKHINYCVAIFTVLLIGVEATPIYAQNIFNEVNSYKDAISEFINDANQLKSEYDSEIEYFTNLINQEINIDEEYKDWKSTLENYKTRRESCTNGINDMNESISNLIATNEFLSKKYETKRQIDEALGVMRKSFAELTDVEVNNASNVITQYAKDQNQSYKFKQFGLYWDLFQRTKKALSEEYNESIFKNLIYELYKKVYEEETQIKRILTEEQYNELKKLEEELSEFYRTINNL